MDFGRVAVVVLAKEPATGRVKTRLCPPLTPDQAARLHDAMVDRWLSRCASLKPAGLVLCVEPADAVERMRARMASFGGRIEPQPAGDLGQRIAAAVSAGLEIAERVIVTGVDSPDVPDSALLRTADLLGGSDMVLCPTEDGGFWAIGVRAGVSAEPLLAGIEWSSGREYGQVADRARESGVPVVTGPRWRDVDHPADLTALLNRLQWSDDPADRAFERELAFLPKGLTP